MNRSSVSIADGLDDVALGRRWDGEALDLATQHAAVSFTDRMVVRRYQHGIARGMDHCTLQRIAMAIRESNL
jgi:hypothetical protein